MSNRKAVIADDEIHIVQVVSIKLRNNGFDCITADNGEQAFELAKSELPDIVVTDCQMPVMTGLELIESLRNEPTTANMPVIMLTAREFEIDEELKSRLNISACLSKPFSPRELLEKIESVLNQTATR